MRNILLATALLLLSPTLNATAAVIPLDDGGMGNFQSLPYEIFEGNKLTVTPFSGQIGTPKITKNNGSGLGVAVPNYSNSRAINKTESLRFEFSEPVVIKYLTLSPDNVNPAQITVTGYSQNNEEFDIDHSINGNTLYLEYGATNILAFVIEGIGNCKDLLIQEVSVVATPLPAALPLYAAGMAVLGLVGWRKRRKAQIFS
ncbi:VPLPA-CTERM sorting domain-containing protein [Sneathiella glossodoripedis]|uniref:VPLPA-CTERM sorting domain-containing protein n=1 Tax=Sneathiella glossodoripedis TaxID=418853 RepID=UPI00046EBA21|nr:VPLPA-CTERM sorting domain-containing protein [Sneathiella glossodoripedis]